MSNSSRHHYIPQFYSRGFTSQEGKFYVYDKEKDSIRKGVSPKSVFYEFDRNTITVGERNTYLEDVGYKQMDDLASKAIRNLRDNANTDSLHAPENLAGVQFFLLNLFWRIPKTDYAFEDLIQRSDISFQKESGEILHDDFEANRLKNDLNYKKLMRFRIVLDALERRSQRSGIYKSKVVDVPTPLVLGDYPFVFKQDPSTFDDLFYLDYVIPLSTRRLYAFSPDNTLTVDRHNIFRINAAIIDQSVRYIACEFLDTLRRSVAYYKGLKEHSLLITLPYDIFPH